MSSDKEQNVEKKRTKGYLFTGIEEFKEHYNLLDAWYTMTPLIVLYVLNYLFAGLPFVYLLLASVVSGYLAKVSLTYYRTKDKPDFNEALKGVRWGRDLIANLLKRLLPYIIAMIMAYFGALLVMISMAFGQGAVAVAGMFSITLLVAVIICYQVATFMVPYYAADDTSLTATEVWSQSLKSVDEEFLNKYFTILLFRFATFSVSVFFLGLPLLVFVPLVYFLETRLADETLAREEDISGSVDEEEIEENETDDHKHTSGENEFSNVAERVAALEDDVKDADDLEEQIIEEKPVMVDSEDGTETIQNNQWSEQDLERIFTEDEELDELSEKETDKETNEWQETEAVKDLEPIEPVFQDETVEYGPFVNK